jgi:hypothetical protein
MSQIYAEAMVMAYNAKNKYRLQIMVILEWEKKGHGRN